ncbi:Transcriptional regulator, effector-binding domain/component OS=Afipia felis OX=1035 GN=NCTC12722_00354 PE=4 SV=1 [Afipia felis]
MTPRPTRLVLLVPIALAAASMAVLPVSAQAPATPTAPAPATADKPAAPPATPAPAPAATPTPATTTPAPAATPTPATPPESSAPAAPATPPGAATPAPASPATEAAPPAKVQAADPFGEETSLTAKKVVVLKGKAGWDSAFETITDSIKALNTLLAKQKIDPAGPVIIVYTSTDDTGFTFLAEMPVNQEPKNLPKEMSIAQSPEGKVLKFVHRGSYDNMDNTYEAITNYLDEKKLEAKDTFIEEYVTDPLKTEEDKLIINVFVPLK